MTGYHGRFDPLGWIISIVAFLYIYTAFTVSAVPYVSRINPMISAVLAALVLIRIVARGAQAVPRCYGIPLLFVIFAALSIAWSTDKALALFMVGYLALSTIGGLSIAVALNYGLSWKVVLWAGICGSLTLLAFAQVQVQEVGTEVRIAGIAGNPNQMALVLSYVAFMLWCCPAKRPKWMIVVGAFFVAYAFAVTGSRMLLITFGGILLLLVAKVSQRVKSAAGRFGLLMALMIGVLVLAVTYQGYYRIMGALFSVKVVERTQQIAEGERSAEIRRDMFWRGIELWMKQPLAGYGEGQFIVVSGFKAYSHNNFTEILANLGIVGFALHYGLHVVLLAYAIRGIRAGSAQHLSALVALLYVLALGLGTVQYYQRYDWIMLAFAANLATQPVQKLPAALAALPRLRFARGYGART